MSVSCFGSLSTKTMGSSIKQKVSYEHISTSDSLSEEDEKGRKDQPVTKNSGIYKQKVSYNPIFTPYSQGINFLSDEEKDRSDTSDLENLVEEKHESSPESTIKNDSLNYNSVDKKNKQDKKKSWGSALKKKILTKSKDRKGNFHKLKQSEDDSSVDENSSDSYKNEDFIYKPFKPSKTETTDTESTTSPKSLSGVLSKVWPIRSNSASSLSRSSSSSSSSSSSPTSERDALIDSLLDKYDGKNYFGESVETAEEATKSSEKLRKQVGLREGEELPVTQKEVVKSDFVMVALSLIILSISWTTIFSGHMLIADESAGLSEGKETLVNQKQKHSGEEMSTTDIPDYNVIDGTGDKSNKSDQVTKKSPRKKQKISYKSIFTTDSSGYNFVSEEDEDGQIDLSVNKNTEIQEQKILDGTVFTSDSPNYNSIDRKNNFIKLQNSNEDGNENSAEGNSKGNKKWKLIRDHYISDETGDIDAESTKTSKSLSKLRSKVWPENSSRRSSLSRSSSSSLSKSERNRIMNQLLDGYKGRSDKKEVMEFSNETEGEELPKVYSGDIHVLHIFDDGQAPTCIFACLFYKMRHSKFEIKPEGRCVRLSMNGPGHGQAPIIELSCLCTRRKKRPFQYEIIQKGETLYYVYNKAHGSLHPLGTLEEIFDYIENNFLQYLKDFLKKKRGIDWKAMYEDIRDLRWIRHDKDDRPIGKYLSETLKEELDGIRHFWTVSLQERLLQTGINRTGSL
ncbi:hypothetical protein V9T40_011082 [Parthenolecanium corni]|uniref:Uncharacterized protein n=1 Tax=Parthenolecanium corni TaxID=536013 RepID=A0AAN9T6C7_9HEMI